MLQNNVLICDVRVLHIPFLQPESVINLKVILGMAFCSIFMSLTKCKS